MSNVPLIFINSDETGHEDVRKAVRARAALYSHRFGPRKPKRLRAAGGRHLPSSDDLTAVNLDIRAGTQPTSSTGTSSTTSTTDTCDTIDQPKAQIGQTRDDYEPILTTHRSPTRRDHSTGYDSIQRLPAQVVTALAADPFETYPVPAQPWFPIVLSNMWPFMMRGWVALDTTTAERTTALLWVQRMTMSNASYFYMNALSVTDDLVHRGILDRSLLYWLTAQVVASINAALQTPMGCREIGVILAVGRIAVREIVQGDRKVGETMHRPAQARMIAMAGGLNALGLPPLVHKHILWADRLMTAITGTSMAQLDPRAISSEQIVESAREHSSDVKVLEVYMPRRKVDRL